MQAALRADDSETTTRREFTLEDAQDLSVMPMPLTQLDTAASAGSSGGRRSCRRRPPRCRRFPNVPAAALWPRRTSCASSPRPIERPTRGTSVRSCAERASTPPPWVTGAGCARPGPSAHWCQQGAGRKSPTQPARGRTGALAKGECPPHAAPGPRRAHHLTPKKVADLLGIPLVQSDSEP